MLGGCQEGAVTFIAHWFNDCVYGWRDGSGFVLGTVAILMWVTAQLPQFLENYRNESVDGLSVWFLGQWFLGDTLNLLGCLMQGEQLPTTTALAMYFVLSDVIMLTQFVYYGALQRRRTLLHERSAARRLRNHNKHMEDSAHQPQFPPQYGNEPLSSNLDPHTGDDLEAASDGQALITAPFQAPAKSRLPSSTLVVAAVGVGSILSLAAVGVASTAWAGGLQAAHGREPLTLLSYQQGERQGGQHGQPFVHGGEAGPGPGSLHAWTGGVLEGHHHDHADGSRGGRLPGWMFEIDWVKLLGSTFGYCSMALYLSSRVSQIFKNWQRNSAEGLSITMFLFTICANMCTGSSILLRTKDQEGMQAQLPWVLGAYGTVGLDVIIFVQARALQRAAAASHFARHGSLSKSQEGHLNPLLAPLTRDNPHGGL